MKKSITKNQWFLLNTSKNKKGKYKYLKVIPLKYWVSAKETRKWVGTIINK